MGLCLTGYTLAHLLKAYNVGRTLDVLVLFALCAAILLIVTACYAIFAWALMFRFIPHGVSSPYRIIRRLGNDSDTNKPELLLIWLDGRMLVVPGE